MKRKLKYLLKLYDAGEITDIEYFEWKSELYEDNRTL